MGRSIETHNLCNKVVSDLHIWPWEVIHGFEAEACVFNKHGAIDLDQPRISSRTEWTYVSKGICYTPLQPLFGIYPL